MATAEFIDLQVNGYAGVDFNGDDVTIDSLHKACRLMRDDGVISCLATIITDDPPVMCRRLKRLVELREKDPLAKEVIAGLHVEGPFINPKRGYVGAHPPESARPADADIAARLLEAGGGLVRVFTLAPEYDAGMTVTRALSRQGVVVSGGHCEADLATLNAALDAGMSMFTHLGNGCPAEIPRHENIIQRVLSIADRLRIGFIVDGVHVPLFALKNYLRAAGLRNCFVVSDAISAAGLGPGVYRLGRHAVAVGEDLVVRSPNGSSLMGSAGTMKRSAGLLHQMGLSDDEVRDLTLHNPRRAAAL